MEMKENRYKEYIRACMADIDGHLKQGEYYEARKVLSDAHGYVFLLEELKHFNASR